MFRSLGSWGVDIFFVISGFIMVFITANHSGGFNETMRFWVKRIIRIAPLYWTITTFVVLLSILAPGVTEYQATLSHVLASYFFIPWQDSRGIPTPALGVGWTLNFEMFFYFAFGIILCLPRRMLITALLAWALASVTIGLIFEFSSPIGGMVTNQRLIEFACGALIGWLWLRQKVIPKEVAMISVVVGFCLIGANVFEPQLPVILKYGVPAALLVIGAVSLETHQVFSFSARFPLSLGDYSYSLYLTHPIILAATGKTIDSLALYSKAPGSVLLFWEVAVAILAGAVVFTYIERPLHNMLATQRRSNSRA